MKQFIVEFVKQFRVKVTIDYIVGHFEHQWGNTAGYGLSVSFGVGLLRPCTKTNT
jgi:hypothetical protein